jgi:threonylcarbamoyladenosine tRNA methylthiotransferase MtaB
MANPASPPSAVFLTLGCKLNLADSETMARRLRDTGWRVADRLATADAVIVNTCSVTRAADHKSRQALRRARRLAPGATIALTGCLLETAPGASVDALGADLVARQPEQPSLVEQLMELRPVMEPAALSGRANLKTRSFVAAQRGCNDVCAFCVIPRTRGRERSRPIGRVVEDVAARASEGVREVVITGTQLGAYGRTGERRPLSELIGAILRETDVPRIRVSSLQPQDIDEDLVALWGDRRLCRHFHLALQSGSEAVLRRMRRRNTAPEYRRAVWLLRERIPEVAITTDVIAGFPGESEAEFEEGLSFCREMSFAAMHVFPFSRRTGTLADRMPGQLPEETRRERVARLIALGDETAEAYRRRLVGSEQEVLWEWARSHEGHGVWEGLTDTYVRVFLESEADLANEITLVRIGGLVEGGVRAEVLAA